MNWFFKLQELAGRVETVWSGVKLIVQAHPELAASVDAVYHEILDAFEGRDLSSVASLVAGVESAFQTFVKTYTGERAAIDALLAQLQSLAS